MTDGEDVYERVAERKVKKYKWKKFFLPASIDSWNQGKNGSLTFRQESIKV